MGCAPASPRRPTESLTFPALGVVTTRGVGQALVIQGVGVSEPVLIVPSDTLIGTFTVRKGEYPLHSENEEVLNFGNVINEGRKATVFQLRADKTICVARGQCAAINHRIEDRLAKQAANSFQ